MESYTLKLTRQQSEFILLMFKHLTESINDMHILYFSKGHDFQHHASGLLQFVVVKFNRLKVYPFEIDLSDIDHIIKKVSIIMERLTVSDSRFEIKMYTDLFFTHYQLSKFHAAHIPASLEENL